MNNQESHEGESHSPSLIEYMMYGFAYCKMLYKNGEPYDYIFVEVNHAFYRLSGFTDAVGKKVSELAPDIHISNPELLETYGRVGLSGKPEKFEAFVPVLNAWLSVSVYSPKPEYVALTFNDITERKKLEEKPIASSAEIQDLYDHAPCGYHSSDPNGTILRMNSTELEWLGYEKEDVIGKMNVSQIYSPASMELFRLILPQFISEGHVKDVEMDLVDRNGAVRNVILSASVISDALGNFQSTRTVLYDITERKLAESTLRESDEKLRGLYELSSLGISLADMDGRYVEFNESFQNICGYSEQELRSLTFWDLTPTKYFSNEMQRLESLGKTGRYGPYEKEYVRKDKSLVPLRFNEVLITGSDGKRYVWSIIEDITELKRVDADLRIAATAFEAKVGIVVTDINSVILKINRTFTENNGYTAEEAVGKTPRILKSGRHDEAFYTEMWKNIENNGMWQGEIWDRRKSGEVYANWMTISAVKDNDGITTHYVGTQIDLTDLKAAEEKIQYLAYYDPLTKLPNRRLLTERLRFALASSARSGQMGGILLIDMDNFKTLNEAQGYEAGDMLLQQVAKRLESCVREGDTMARLGGDEFVVMLEDLSKQVLEAAGQTEAVGMKIRAALSQPYQLASYEYHGTPSIGATLLNGHKHEVDELLKQADIAMYQAKNAGRNTLCFFDPKMQDTISTRAALEDELRKAIENQQLHLYYQIQVDDTRHPLGAEALIRWIHPERGLVSPAQFIPLAEETELILPIGKWVLETACANLKNWEHDSKTSSLVLAVNVSAKQFRQTGFVTQVTDAVQRHGINPNRLKLELTEGMLLDNVESTIAIMNKLKEFGIRFSLDDFGTGYSSLQYLKRLPLDQLKIDQSFVRDIEINDSDKAIVSTVIAMAKSLNLDVIAEGVETEEQRDFLITKGCTNFQGYLFSKPVPIQQFYALL